MVRSQRESTNEIAKFGGLKLQIPAISNAPASEKQTPAQSLTGLFTDDYRGVKDGPSFRGERAGAASFTTCAVQRAHTPKTALSARRSYRSLLEQRSDNVCKGNVRPPWGWLSRSRPGCYPLRSRVHAIDGESPARANCERTTKIKFGPLAPQTDAANPAGRGTHRRSARAAFALSLRRRRESNLRKD